MRRLKPEQKKIKKLPNFVRDEKAKIVAER
jgi:hypothetical protein